MKKQNLWFVSMTVLAALLAISPCSYADDTTGFNDQIKAIQAHRAQIEKELGIKPHGDNYDLADHYAQDHLMRAVDDDVDIC